MTPDSNPKAGGVAGRSSAEETAAEAATPSKSPRGKWRRRIVRTLFVAATLVVVFRLALALLLPTVLHRTARQFGFNLDYRRLDLNLLGTQAGMWGLSLRPTDDPNAEVLHTDYAFANISSLALFKLKLVAYRLEADGVQLNVVRKPDGSIPLLDRINAALASDAPPSNEPLRFESPVRVEAVRLQHVNIDLRDESVTPPFHDQLTLNLRVSDVGEIGKPVTLDVELYSKSMLEALRVRGDVRLLGEELTGSLTFGVYGLRMKDAQAYLASLGVQSDDLPLSLTGTAELSLKTLGDKAGALTGVASVSGLRLVSGGDEAVRLKHAQVPILELSPSTLHVGRVTAEGGVLRLRRTPEGLMTFAGISPARGAAVTTPPLTISPSGAPGSTPASAPTENLTPFGWRLDELAATDLTGEFSDHLFSPEGRFEARVSSFGLKNVASTGTKDDVATLSLAMNVPGVASALRVSGTATPFAEVPGATVVFDATGLRPDALRPYLAPLGIEPLLTAGSFHAAIEATADDFSAAAPRVAFKLSDIRLDDGGTSLLNMPLVSVSGLKRDPSTGAIEVAEIEATGPALTIRRIDDKTLELPAFRYRSVRAAATEQPATAPVVQSGLPATAPAVAPPSLPIVRVNRLAWGGAKIRLEDHSTEGTEPIELSDARLELTGFVLDLRPDAPPSPPGKITGRFTAPGLADGIRVDGTLTAGSASLAADVALAAEGLNLQRLAPYLRPVGVETRLKQGAMKASGRASVARHGDLLRLAAEVRDAELSDGDVRLLALAGASVDRFEISPKGYSVGDVTITKPYARVERDADGGLIAGGVKLVPAAPTTRPALAGSLPASSASAANAAPDAAPAPPVDPFGVLTALPPLALKSLKLESGEVDWLDRMTPEPVELKLAATASLDSLALNQRQPEVAKFEVVVSSPKLAERVRVTGSIEPKPESISLVADVDAAGLDPEAVAPYLPAGIRPTMKAGAFKTVATVNLARHAEGGVAGTVKVDGLSLRDGAADAPPLAAIEGLDLRLDRFDPATGDVSLAQVAVTGIEGAAVREADGALSLLGLRIAPSPPPPPSGTAEAGAAAPAAPPIQPSPSADIQEIAAESKRTLPMLSLATLDVRVKRLAFEDRMRNAAPTALADSRIWNDGPIELLGPTPQSNAPIKLNVTGAIEPALRHFDVTARVAPFAERPTVGITIDASGIDGEGLVRAAPELAETFDGRPLTDGRFKTVLEAEANVRRRGPTQIDLSRGLELNVSVTQTAFRNGENGPVLAGVGAVRGEQVKVETRTGDVTVRSLEVNDLVANAWRETTGIYVLGLRIKGTEVAPADGTPPAPPPEQADAAAAAPAAEATASAGSKDGPTGEAKPEVRIDRLTISGLDFRFEDRALSPPVLIPITSLEAEVRGLSSLAMERERTARFNVSLGAGKVSLPKKLRGGVLSGALGDLSKLAGGSKVDAAPEFEDRDFFAQISAAGSLKLFPKPAGRALASMNGVELSAIRGLAASSGIGLNAGTFDGRIEMKTIDDEKLDVRSRFVLTDLSVTEPPGGPIVRYLSLPAPLDVVIGAVEAPDRSITLPIRFQVDGATTKGIVPAAVGAISQVLVTAVASAPVKAVTGVAGLFGDTTKEMEVVQEPPVYVEFPAGVVTLDPVDALRLQAILARATRDKSVRIVVEHELGEEDVAIAARRANPPAAQAKVLAENLLLRRRELLLRRDELLGPARAAALQSRGAQQVAAVRDYRDVSAELAAAEDALDRLYEFQRPGADRLADRRTRAAAIEIADGRLTRVRSMVQAFGNASAAERVRVGTARFVSHGNGPSRLVIGVARAVPRGRRAG